MTLIFLLAVGFCLYTYVGFPLWLHWQAARSRYPEPDSGFTADHENAERPLPRVSLVMAAHNEADTLPGKFRSLDALDYPADSLECIVVSDGSTDATVKVLESACRSRPGWQFHHYEPAAGKPTALNQAVARARGDILVFMDARQSVSPLAVRLLVERLQQDDSIGAASGELVLASDAGMDADKVSLYWKYEKWIRENESALFSTTGATGALYAIRRADYRPLPENTLLDDFDTPVALLAEGKRTVFVPGAQVFDQAEADATREFTRKVRTLTGNFQSFARHGWLFDPRRNPVWWQFLSHKVFRLLVPYAMLLALLASLNSDSVFMRTMLLLQLAFYALGLLGFLGWNNRLSSVIKVFLQLNAAAVLGAWRAITGQNRVRWKAS